MQGADYTDDVKTNKTTEAGKAIQRLDSKKSTLAT